MKIKEKKCSKFSTSFCKFSGKNHLFMFTFCCHYCLKEGSTDIVIIEGFRHKNWHLSYKLMQQLSTYLNQICKKLQLENLNFWYQSFFHLLYKEIKNTHEMKARFRFVVIISFVTYFVFSHIRKLDFDVSQLYVL